MIVLLIGAVIGFTINGLLIGKLRVNFFVITLGTMTIYRSAVYFYTDGKTTYIDKWPLIRSIADGTIAGIPIPIIIMLAIFLSAFFVLKHTSYGRAVYAIGGNREAVILSGINAGLVEASVYGISGLLAALGGIVQAGRLAAASPVVGTGIALEVAAVVLLGGTSFSGGIGGVVGTVIGAFFIGLIKNGLGIAGIESFWQGVITGVILILAVLFDRLQARQGV
jgi:ribose transport system permease protein